MDRLTLIRQRHALYLQSRLDDVEVPALLVATRASVLDDEPEETLLPARIDDSEDASASDLAEMSDTTTMGEP